MGTKTINIIPATAPYNVPAPTTPPAANTPSPAGVFVYNGDRQGWEIPAAVRTARNLPNLIVVNADSRIIGIIEDMLGGASPPTTVPDATTLAFFNLLSIPQPIPNTSFDATKPESATNVRYVPRTDTAGTTFFLDIRMIASTLGGRVAYTSRGAGGVAGTATRGFVDVVDDKDTPMPATGTFADHAATADARAFINLLLPLTFLNAQAQTEFMRDHVANNANVLQIGDVFFFNMFDISNTYFRQQYGVVTPRAFFEILTEHELVLHPGMNENPNGNAYQFGGHSQILASLLTRADDADLEIKRVDIRDDPVEGRAWQNARAAGRLSSSDDYLDSRRAAYRLGLNRYIAIIERNNPGLKIETVGDLRAAMASGEYKKAEDEIRAASRSSVNATMIEGPNGIEVAISEFFEGSEMALTTFDGAQLGIAFGSVLGKRVTDNPFGQIVASAALKTILGAFGEALDPGRRSTNILGNGVEGLFDNFKDNLVSGAIGAVSSYITAEVVKAIGVDGLLGEALNSVGGSVLNKILTNIAVEGANIGNPAQLFAGINPLMLANVAGSFIGQKLAAEVKTFNTIGGQIGSAVGAAYGAWAAGKAIAALGIANPLVAIAIVAAVVFIDTLIGGYIGSLFGGTPRSGADTVWDAGTGQFSVANVYSRKGGSKDAAKGLATAVAANLNAVLTASEATLLDPGAVQAGNYGMRIKDYVYRPTHTRDKDAITARFTGKTAPTDIVNHGTYLAVDGLIKQLAGGNVFVKRAVVASLENAKGNPNSAAKGAAGEFQASNLLGDINIGREYDVFLKERDMIGALVAAAPESAFAAGWLVTLTRARELGLDRRAFSDWIGGYGAFLDEVVDGKVDGQSTSAAWLSPSIDKMMGARTWSVYDANDVLLGLSNDTIDTAAQTRIDGTAGADTITLGADRLFAPDGTTNIGLTVGGEAHSAEMEIRVAALIDGGAGDDRIQASDRGDNVFGGAGVDTLYGGKLDDWLLGGDGDDMVNAGSAEAGTVGGEGNYLDGGAGNDTLIGREGSDWLEGGTGTDVLEGGDGGDILAGGAGHADIMRGGRGDDQYIFRIGDVGSLAAGDADIVRDESGLTVATVVAQAYNDYSAPEIDGFLGQILSGLLFRAGRGLDNWRGGGVQVSVTGRAAGGDDVLVFGTGIGLDDIKIFKSANGADLVVELWPDGIEIGDRIVLADWFTSFNKVETLRFADGNEVRIADFDTFILGSDGSETIVGTANNDFLHAGSGDDHVFLLAGNDFGNGGLGNDTVSGDIGSDIVMGGHGDDTLHGGSGADTVSGGQGRDSIHGDADNDILAGGGGNDEIIGGAGDDIIKYSRGDGEDVVIDALSNDWEVAWVSGQGWQNGYAVNADGTIGHATLGLLHDGQNWLARTHYDVDSGTFWRHRPASLDAVVANSGNDAIEFGIGIDINDIQIGRGNGDKDLILGIEPSRSGAIAFSALTDRIVLKEWGPSGNAAARGSIESLVFFNTGALDLTTLRLNGGTDGDDVIVGVSGAPNWLTGGLGNDSLTGDALRDILNGNAGDDRLVGLGDADVLLGGAGNDILIGGAGSATAGDTLIGGSGLDMASYETATAGVRASLEEPKAANDASAGDAAGDTFDGIEGLRGSAFGDELEGNSGENSFEGGLGNDSLRGGLGDDLYVFGRGDGQDMIADQYAPSKEVVVDDGGGLDGRWTARMELMKRENGLYHFDHVVAHAETGEIAYRRSLPGTANRELAMPTGFDAEGWARDDEDAPIFTPTGNGGEVADVADMDPGGSDTLLFEDYTGTAGYAGEQAIGLSDLVFAFDTGANADDLLISLVGSAGDQVRIKGFRSGAAVNPNSVIETIQFSDGSSVNLAGLKFDAAGVLLSASGDTLAAPVDDLLVGTSGDETITGGYGKDSLSGMAGNDWLQGGDGDDLLSGGLGSDILHGGDGIDTATYTGSDGPTGVTINLLSGSPGSGGEAAGDNFNSIENIVGTHFADNITGDTKDNVLKGNRGNDSLTGGLGADVLIGDDGNDTLTGNVHDDALDGGAGNDVLNGGGDKDVLSGGDGNDILRGDGTFGSDAGGNQLINFSFEDSGDIGNDVAQSYGLTSIDLPGWKIEGDRPVQLTTSASGVAPSLGARSLHLDDGVGNAEISQIIGGFSARESLNLFLSSAGRTAGASSAFEVLWNGNVVITVASGTTTWSTRNATLTTLEGDNVLTVRGLGAVDGLGALIDNIRVTRTLGAADTLIGGAGTDLLEGGYGNDTLLGGDGNDSSAFVVTGATMGGLLGGAGDDVLDGGAGDDSLDGGAGADRYVFRLNSGNDIVTAGNGADELLFDGVNWDTLWLSQVASSQDLLVTAIGSGTSVRVKNWFAAASNRARRIVVGDKMLSRFDVQSLVTAMAAESAAVPAVWPASPSAALTGALSTAWQSADDYVDRAVVIGTAGNDYLQPDSNFIDSVRVDVWAGPVRYEGLAGNDVIEASGTDDVLIGGEGNDTLLGGMGDDEFRFGTEAGFDAVHGSDGSDAAVATADGARINLQALSGIETISGKGFADVQIVAAAEMTLDLSEVAVDGIAQITGSAGAETITGSAGADRILGGAGDDTLAGGGGDDWIQGGEGSDHHDGGAGTDTLDQSHTIQDQAIDLEAGTIIEDVNEIATGFENAVGGGGNDVITGTAGANRLDGRDGDDALIGGDGADLLIGGSGADAMTGGAGSDTASYETQSGVSSITSSRDGVELDGVVASLAASTGQQGDAAGDTFSQVENLTGTSFNDSLTGDDGDNILTGGAGSDFLSGGLGEDIAQYAGNQSDYEILATTPGAYTVRDLNLANGDEGLDRLTDIEKLRFANGTISLGVDENNAPELGEPIMADQIWDDGVATSYQIPETAFIDIDDDALTFVATLADGSPLPSWLGWYPATRTFLGTAPFTAVGTVLDVMVTASDGSASVSDSFLIGIGEAPGPDVTGTAGADALPGTVRKETMIGLTGDDVLAGSPGADRLDGGADLDTADYSGSDAAVSVDLTAGTGAGGHAQGDQLISIEKVIGSAYGDTIIGSADANHLSGGGGNDNIQGSIGDDLIEGGSGADVLAGNAGDDSFHSVALADGQLEDMIDGGAGNDTVYLSASAHGAVIDLAATTGTPIGVEHVTGSAHADTIAGNEAANILSGGLGNDVLSGAGGNDTLNGGEGNDVLSGGSGANVLYGDEGDDRMVGGAGADTFYGGGGTDIADYRASTAGVTVNLSGGTASGGDAAGDTFVGGQTENIDATDFGDVLTGTTSANVLKGFAGADTIHGGGGNDTIEGGAGADTLRGDAGADILIGGTEDDALHGGDDDDTLSGDDGNDSLFGDAGADTLWGGAGNDTLDGGSGNDTINAGLGDDMIVMSPDAVDTVDGGSGTDTASYAAQVTGVTVDLASTTDTLSNIENVTGGSGADTLTGSATANLLRGGAGNDIVHGGAGDDDLRGESGADTLRGDAGNDTISGGSENDILYGGSENDTLSGDDGNDVLHGEAGIDSLSGGLGDDDFHLVTVGEDVVDGGAGIDRALFTSSSTEVIVDLDLAAHKLTNVEDVLTGTGNDNIKGSSAANRLDGGAGNDTLDGRGGNDILAGGDGDDRLIGGTGADALQGGAGSDTADYRSSATGITVNLAAGTASDGDTLSAIENVDGSDSADTLTGDGGDNVLKGFAGDDVLNGGGGNDVLDGGAGADTLSGGDGADTLSGGSDNDTIDGGLGLDSISGGDGDDMIVMSPDASDTVDGGAGTDTVSYAGFAAGVTVDLASTADAISNVENVTGGSFADTLTGTAAANLLRGGAGNDVLQGAAGDDTLHGEAGADMLYGGAGSDTLTGGSENDTLYGGSENDTLSGDDGNDVLHGEAGIDTLSGGLGDDDFHLLNVGEDTVDGGAGVDRALFTSSIANLVIDLNLAAHKLTGIETVVTGSGHDDIKGTTGANRLEGGAGNDILEGRGGGDVLVGGDGIDTVSYAGAAAGTPIAIGLWGGLTINGVALLSAVAKSTDGVIANLLDGYAAGAATGDSWIGIENVTGTAFADGIRGIAAGTIVRGGLGDDVIFGGAGNDTLYGDAGNDFVFGEAGTDTLYGGDGDDRILGGLGVSTLYGGDGNDTLGEDAAGGGQDIFDGGAGDDLMFGTGDADSYDGGSGTDTIDFRSSAAAVKVNLSTAAVNGVAANRGAGGDAELDTYVSGSIENVTGSAYGDELTGSAAANVLSGGGGDDTLTGGAGNDSLLGGAGNDSLVGGAGADQFDGGGGDDTVSYAAAPQAAAGTAVASALVGGVAVVGYNKAAISITLDGVRVNLAANNGSGSDAAGDTFAGIDNLIGSSSNDMLLGTDDVANVTGDGLDGINRIEGGAGDDLIYGGSGNDKLFGNAGDDIIYGGANVDELWGGENADRLFGDGESDKLHGEGGDDILHAGDEGDELWGGADTDILIGGGGGDTYYFNLGDGTDTIHNYEDHANVENERDVVQFGGIANTNLWFTKVDNDLLVSVLGSTTDTLTVADWFSNSTAGNWDADDAFVVNRFLAGEWVEREINLPNLLQLMTGTKPALFTDLSTQLQAEIAGSWERNTKPIVTAAAGNVLTASESTPPIELRFTVKDEESALSGISLTAVIHDQIGPIPVFQAIQPADIVLESQSETDRTKTYKVTVRRVPDAHGTTSFRITGNDGFFTTALDFTMKVLAVADPVLISAPVVANGNAGTTIMLPGTRPGGALVQISDFNSEVFDYVRVEAVPVGVMLSDGVNSFTSAAGATTATITGWNLGALRVTPVAGSAADFAMTLRARSRENLAADEILPGGEFGPESTTTLTVNVNGTPTAVTLTYQVPLFDENVANAIVGALGAVDPGDATGIYTYKIIGGAAAAKFIDPNDAVGVTQLRLAVGQSLDYEAGNAQIIVRVTDRTIPGSPVSFDQTLNIRPANVNEAPNMPTDVNGTTNAVTEGAGAGTAVGISLVSTDPDGTAPTYVLASDPMNWFAISPAGVVTVRSGANIDFESLSIGVTSITVQAFDGSLYSPSLALSINIADVNETPVFTSPASVNIAETVVGGSIVITPTASDPDKDALSTGEAGLVYTIVGGTGTALFEMVAGQVRTKAGTAFDYDAGTRSYSLILRARDTNNTGLYAEQSFTVNITDVNEAPTTPADSNAAGNAVIEGATAGTTVGVTMVSTDPEGAAVTYLLTADSMNWFAIAPTTGVVTVRAGAVVNFETAPGGAAQITVQASDGANVQTSTLSIAIGDVNEAPVITSASGATILETTGGGVTVMTVTATDPDLDYAAHGEAGLVYSIVGGTGTGLFEMVSGQIRTRAGAAFDYDAGLRSYSLTVRAQDSFGQGLGVDQAFTVTIANVNEAPTTLGDNDPAANSVSEGAGAGTSTGITLITNDPEGAVTYMLNNDPFSWFAVNAQTGAVTVRSGAVIDHEQTTNGTVAINVQATDTANQTVVLNNLVISITDVNEAPVFTSGTSASISETAMPGSFVAALSATDPDRDNVANGEAGFIYSLSGTGTGAGLFDVIGTEIRTRAGAAFNFDGGAQSYTLGVRVRDNYNSGLFVDQTVTIAIANVDEAPSRPHSFGGSITENAAFSVGLSGSVDPEGGEVDYDFNLTTGGNPGGLFAIDNVAGNTATLRLIAPVDFETIRNQPYYTAEAADYGYVTVRFLAKDPAGNVSEERERRIYIDDANDNAPSVPVVASWGTTVFNENSGAETLVATLTSPTDVDQRPATLSYELTSNPGGMFIIVGNEIRTRWWNFDYEAFASGGASTALTVGVRTSDGVNYSSASSFTVTLNNLDDNAPIAGGITMQNGYSTTLTEHTITPLQGLVIAKAFVSDADGDALTYSIVAGNGVGAFAIDGSGNISAPNGIDYEQFGPANLGVDPSVPVALTIRAQSGNNYVDQVLNLSIADIQQFNPIYSGNGLYYDPNVGSQIHIENLSGGFKYQLYLIYGDGWMMPSHVALTIYRDDDNNQYATPGDFVLTSWETVYTDYYAPPERPTTYHYLRAGYRWEGTPWASSFLQELPPIVLDLNGDGRFAGNVTVSFDIDGDGARDKTGWIDAGDAFLVLDRNADGSIDHGAEMSFIGDLPGATSDLDGLRAFDSNADGIFDARDERFGEFQVWQDADQDGVSDPGELRTLAEAGIASIGLTRTNGAAASDEGEQVLLGTAAFTRADGTTGQIGDVTLRWEEDPSAPKRLPENGRVAIDRDGNGVIDPATEVTGAGLPLTGFDSNGDGLISAADARYFDLRLWTDANENGRAEPDEIVGLDRAGLTTISAMQPAAPIVAKVPPAAAVTPAAIAAAAPAALPATAPTTPTAAAAQTASASTPAAGEPPAPATAAVGAATAEALSAAPAPAELLKRGSAAWVEHRYATLQTSLRAIEGRGDARYLSMAGSADAFDLMEAQSAAAARFMAGDGDLRTQDLPKEAIGADVQMMASDSLMSARMAQIVQSMASFGAREGESSLRERSASETQYDYFAG